MPKDVQDTYLTSDCESYTWLADKDEWYLKYSKSFLMVEYNNKCSVFKIYINVFCLFVLSLDLTKCDIEVKVKKQKDKMF